MSNFSKIIYNGKLVKLEIFNKSHKLAKSLPVHRRALEAGLIIPKIYKIEEKADRIYKYTEWVDGNTIQYEMDNNINLISLICMDLARYVNELYDVDNITAVDSHFRNFVWSNNQVVYIDLKKLLYRNYEEHILQMSKICLKSCKGDRRKTLSFLKGYAMYRDVKPIIRDCNNRNWQWKDMKGNIFKVEPIRLGEIV